MFGIMAGMGQKNTYSVGCFPGDELPRAVFLPWLTGPDARHHGRYEPAGQSCCEVLRSLPTSAVAYLAGYAGDDIFAVFPSVVVGMLKMLGILVGMDQKDSLQRHGDFVVMDSGMCKAGFARNVAPRVVFPLLVGRPAARSWPRSRRRQWWQYTAGFACDDAHHVACRRQLTRSCRTRVLTCPLLCWTVWSRQFLARLWMCLSLCNDRCVVRQCR